MYIYILVGILILFALYKERQALGCPEPPSGADCDNDNGKAVRGTKPLPSDSNEIIYKKLQRAASFGDRWVMWRIGFILSLPCVLLTYFILSLPEGCSRGAQPKIPSEKELVVGMFVITALVYFMLNFYKFHLINVVQNNVDEGVRILKGRCP